MTHETLMTLADAYANSYMTFHEKAARAALSEALREVVQDAARLNWFNKGKGVFRVADTWYYKTSYARPARKHNNIRAAIDAAMKEPT